MTSYERRAYNRGRRAYGSTGIVSQARRPSSRPAKIADEAYLRGYARAQADALVDAAKAAQAAAEAV